MPAITTAFRAFFRALFDAKAASQIAAALDGKPAIAAKSTGESGVELVDDSGSGNSSSSDITIRATVKPKKSTRSDAIALLEQFQREARLIDFLMEDVSEYSDEQIGAAVRDVHRGCRELVERSFEIEPISDQEEGSTVEVKSGFSAAVYRLVGNVGGAGPYQGELLHRGWRVAKVALPQWNGAEDAKHVISPVEVEVK